MAMVMCFVSAAFVTVKTVNAGVSFAGYAYVYRNGSQVGNLVGLYEVIPIVAYNLWSLALTVTAIVAGALMWNNM